MQLDLAAHYFLFSLIEEQLPRRAKLFFIAKIWGEEHNFGSNATLAWTATTGKSRLMQNNRLYLLYISSLSMVLGFEN